MRNNLLSNLDVTAHATQSQRRWSAQFARSLTWEEMKTCENSVDLQKRSCLPFKYSGGVLCRKTSKTGGWLYLFRLLSSCYWQSLIAVLGTWCRSAQTGSESVSDEKNLRLNESQRWARAEFSGWVFVADQKRLSATGISALMCSRIECKPSWRVVNIYRERTWKILRRTVPLVCVWVKLPIKMTWL